MQENLGSHKACLICMKWRKSTKSICLLKTMANRSVLFYSVIERDRHCVFALVVPS